MRFFYKLHVIAYLNQSVFIKNTFITMINTIFN